MPKRTWLSDITEWTGIGITTCMRETEDRQKWRKIAKSSKWPQRQTKATGVSMTDEDRT